MEENLQLRKILEIHVLANDGVEEQISRQIQALEGEVQDQRFTQE